MQYFIPSSLHRLHFATCLSKNLTTRLTKDASKKGVLCRLVLIEESALKASTDYMSTLDGPKLDDLPFEMVDTGKSRSKLLTGHNSFSSSRGSSSDSNVWSVSPAKKTSSMPSRKSTLKRFQIGRWKKKDKEPSG